jgi:hypothetical protein
MGGERLRPNLPIFSMNLPRIIVTALVICGASLASLFADEKAKFSEHPFFKHFVGSWKSEGELKSADGNTVKIAEEWTCKISDEGGLVIEGSRSINEQLPSKYEWTITHNPTTDLYEAVQVLDKNNPENTLRFEGSITGEPPVLELKSQFGNGGGSATVTDTFTGEGHDTFESKIVLLKDNGDPNLEGTLKNERVK